MRPCGEGPAHVTEFREAQEMVLGIASFLSLSYSFVVKRRPQALNVLELGSHPCSPGVAFCCWQSARRKYTSPEMTLLVLQSSCDLWASPPPHRDHCSEVNLGLFKGTTNLKHSVKESGARRADNLQLPEAASTKVHRTLAQVPRGMVSSRCFLLNKEKKLESHGKGHVIFFFKRHFAVHKCKHFMVWESMTVFHVAHSPVNFEQGLRLHRNHCQPLFDSHIPHCHSKRLFMWNMETIFPLFCAWVLIEPLKISFYL